MRLVKMLGLAAIAALAAMAFLGAGTASAGTTLCKQHEEPCQSANQFPSGTVIHGELLSGTIAELLSDLGNVKCSTSTVLGKTTAQVGEPLTGEIETVSFTNCKVGLFGCTVTVEGTPYNVLVLLSGGGAYHWVVHNGKASVVCATIINCTYGASEILFGYEELLANGDGDLTVLQELAREGTKCGTTATWHAKYLVRALENGSPVSAYLRMAPLP